MKDVFMKEAISLAQENADSVSGGPFGAVIVKDGKIISKASNSVTVDNDPTAHAEVNAIRLACKELKTFDLSGCVLYTSCEPCPMCLSAVYWARLDKIYYAADRVDAARAGFDDEFLYREFHVPLGDRKIRMDRVMAAEGLVPFQLWKENGSKVEY